MERKKSSAKYFFLPLSEDPFLLSSQFELYETGQLLVKFTRQTSREDLEPLGRSSQWIGSILKLLSKQYPLKYSCPVQQLTPLERLLRTKGEDYLADYLRSKGFRVFKPLPVSDEEIIEHLELKGYLIEGLLNDIYYRSPLLVYNDTNIFEKERR